MGFRFEFFCLQPQGRVFMRHRGARIKTEELLKMQKHTSSSFPAKWSSFHASGATRFELLYTAAAFVPG